VHTFEEKPKGTQQVPAARSGMPKPALFGYSEKINSTSHWQRTLGNQVILNTQSEGSDILWTTPAGPIQTKLTINQPGDEYEQEADRMADIVIRMLDPGLPQVAHKGGNSKPMPSIFEGQQKSKSRKGIEEDEEDVLLKKVVVAEKCNCEEDEKRVSRKTETPYSESFINSAGSRNVAPELGARIQGMRGDGRTLTASESSFMEPRFGADFSAIRIHTDQEADMHSRALHARAFTVGGDIFFRAGEYTPGEAESHRLLAHELTHSLQQGAAHSVIGPYTGARSTAVPFLQPQPRPSPIPPPFDLEVVAAPPSRTTINFLPILYDLSPPSAGLTRNDDPVFDITAYASDATWDCVITTADQQSHQGVRLPPGIVEVTPKLVADETNCATLQTMITSLNSIANQNPGSGFYMLAAVQAHEDVHIKQYREGLAPHYDTLRMAIEGLAVPLAGNTAASAKAAIKALPTYTEAMATFHAADVAVNNATADHTPIAPFKAAEHGIVDPMIATIRARRTTLKCP
jgi:hypothetical protein